MKQGPILREGDSAPIEVYWDNPVASPQGLALVRPMPAPERPMPLPPDQGMMRATAAGQQLYLVIQHEGGSQLVQGRWETVLGTGDLALSLGSRPRCLNGEGARHQVLRFNMAGLPDIPHETLRSLPAVLPGRYPATQLMVRMAETLDGAADELAAPLLARFLGSLLDMLATTLQAQRETLLPVLPRMTRYHLERIKEYLGRHLRDPGLSVRDVALALDMSVSHVHRIFAHEGCTVSEWLWSRRLEGCAGELASPAHAHRMVGEIALAWGFNDLSHFSRVFRQRFGMTPKEWRNQAPWRKPLLGMKCEA